MISNEPIAPDYKARLLKLADFLEVLNPVRFDYRTWVGEDWQDDPDLSCGTTACALGWATVIFKDEGLCLRRNADGDPVVAMDWMGTDHLGPVGVSVDAAKLFFNLSRGEAFFLFMPAAGAIFDGKVMDSPEADAGPEEVALHIKKFVEVKYK